MVEKFEYTAYSNVLTNHRFVVKRFLIFRKKSMFVHLNYPHTLRVLPYPHPRAYIGTRFLVLREPTDSVCDKSAASSTA